MEADYRWFSLERGGQAKVSREARVAERVNGTRSQLTATYLR
jgi:hypothetical protein